MRKEKALLIIAFLLIIGNLGISQVQFEKHDIGGNTYGGGVVADLEGDGDKDIILMPDYFGNKTYWWESDIGDSLTFSFHTLLDFKSYYLAVTDLDKDGDNDLVTSSNNGFEWWQNDGTNTNYQKIVINQNYVNADKIQVLDFDGDEDLDVVASSWENGYVIWLENAGSQNFTSHIILTEYWRSTALKIIDFDKDGDLDIITSTSNSLGEQSIVYLKRKSILPAVFTKHIIFEDTENFMECESLDIIDFDNDGDYDIIAAIDNNQIDKFENMGGDIPQFTRSMISYFPSPLDVKLNDLDMDGDFDIICSSYSDSIYVWWNDGTPDMNFNKQFLLPENIIYDILLSDMDNDGDMDICTTKQGIKWWENLSASVPTSITAQPIGKSVCLGENATFAITASGDNLSYQWQKDNADISGATSDSYTISAVSASDAGEYRCVVSGDGGAVTSDAATLTVLVSTTITTQAQSQTVCEGQSSTFAVEATGDNIGYQWQKDNQDISGATSATYTINSTTIGDAGNYTCVVSGTCGTITSDAATLTVKELISISSQPQSIEINKGKQAVFSVAASGTISTYQWYKDGTALSDGGKYTGTTTAQLTISDVAQSEAGSYTVKISGDCGDVTSDAATLSVLTATDNIANAGITIIPNPAHDYIKIINTGQKINKLEIYNTAGIKVLQKSKDFEHIDLSGLEAGVYFVKVVRGSEVRVERVVHK